MKTLTVFLLVIHTAYGMSLQWDANPPEDQVTSYNIYRVKNAVNELVGSVDAPNTIFRIDEFLEERTDFYVVAVNNAGQSEPSSKVIILRCSMWTTMP
jgi:hypothetical protein